MGGGADAAGDVHPPVGGAFKQGAAGPVQGLVPSFPRQVRHGGVEVHGPDAVAHRLPLVPHRGVALVIGGVLGVHAEVGPAPLFGFLLKEMGILPPLVDKVGGQIQVPLFPGGPVQPQQCQLDFLVAGDTFLLAFSEPGVDVVRHPAHHLQQLVLAGGFIIGHRRFHHVAGAVQLMAFL